MVRAATDLELQALGCDRFLPVVTGFPPSSREAAAEVEEMLDRFRPGEPTDEQKGQRTNAESITWHDELGFRSCLTLAAGPVREVDHDSPVITHLPWEDHLALLDLGARLCSMALHPTRSTQFNPGESTDDQNGPRHEHSNPLGTGPTAVIS